MAARNEPDQCFGTALDRITACLAEPFATGDISVDLFVRQPLEGDDGFDGAGLGGAESGIGSQPTNMISLGGFAIEPAYQVSFSQHYRQQLLACF